MKKRGILIGAAAGLVVLTAGIIVAIYLSNPEVLTRPLLESQIPEEGTPEWQTPQGVVITPMGGIGEGMTDFAGSCLLFSEKNCLKTFILHAPDGSRTYGVGVNDLAADMPLYAPMDGDVSYTNDRPDGNGLGMLILATNGPWSPARTMEELKDDSRNKSLIFVGYGVRPIINGPVKKGDQIGVYNPGDAILADFIKEDADMVIGPETDWDSGIARSENAAEYMQQIFQLINSR